MSFATGAVESCCRVVVGMIIRLPFINTHQEWKGRQKSGREENSHKPPRGLRGEWPSTEASRGVSDRPRSLQPPPPPPSPPPPALAPGRASPTKAERSLRAQTEKKRKSTESEIFKI
jgi:hypothetical protein